LGTAYLFGDGHQLQDRKLLLKVISQLQRSLCHLAKDLQLALPSLLMHVVCIAPHVNTDVLSVCDRHSVNAACFSSAADWLWHERKTDLFISSHGEAIK